jgi:23S rRNA pseudouridine1911/1915/1917 synthase
VSEKLLAEEMPLDIVYEDRDLLVLNKPAGLVVHPGAGNRSGTLVNGLLHHCQTLSTVNGALRPGIVHRLDKNTSGLLVVAKTDSIHSSLARQFETRDIIRTYQAVVWGDFKSAEGKIESYIDRSRRNRQKMAVVKNHGKWALTTYRVLLSFKYFSFVELMLKTGRTHQIRVHLSHIHHPVLGDPEYNGRQEQLSGLPLTLRNFSISLLKRINRQALHARKLSFIHPRLQERVYFESDLPSDIQQIVDELATL